MSKVTQEEIDRIIDLWRDRHTVKYIAITVGRSYTTVYYILRKRYLIG